MPCCHEGCGLDVNADGSPLHETQYGDETFAYCALHWSTDVFHTANDRHIPSQYEDRITYWDGGSCMRHAGGVYYQWPDHPDESWRCDSCSCAFYGEGVYLEDDEETVCLRCAEEHCCRDGDDWYRRDPDGPTHEPAPRRPADSTASVNGFPIFKGEATDQFMAQPLVGIEFEHAPVRYKGASTDSNALFDNIRSRGSNYEHITCHSDGSIANMSGYSSKEIVTMPASGDKLEFVINEFYRPFAEGVFTPGPEHHTCGFHVHVGSRFLFMIRGGTRFTQIPVDVKLAAKDMLRAMATIASEYVSSTRRSNQFCRDLPSVRDKSLEKAGTDTMIDIFGRTCYPSVAIRTIGTVEFRLWPSSNIIQNTKARVELSQRLVDYWDRCLMDGNDQPVLDAEAAKTLCDMANLCRGGERKKLTAALAGLLSLSDTATQTLSAMASRFSPFSHQKTTFRFSELQIASMKDEDSTVSTDYLQPDKFSCHSVGDTTMRGNIEGQGEEEFISFSKGIKCYPAQSKGEQVDAIMQFAKGEL